MKQLSLLAAFVVGCTSPTHDHSDASASNDGDGAIVDSSSGRDLSTDRTKFFGDSRCATAGVELCEDFENGLGSAWTIDGAPAPVIEVAQHARGAHALHITKTGNGASRIRETITFPAANNSYYGRAFFYFVTLPTAAEMTYSHWSILASAGLTPSGTTAEIRVSGQLRHGHNLFGVGTDDKSPTGTGDWTQSDDDPAGHPTDVPLGTWVCIEWMHDSASNETRFWWDAVEHPSMHTTETIHGGDQSKPYILPQPKSLWVGWQEYQSPAPVTFDLWVDEIAIDSQRIGCVI
jgi:hypothetical protein